MKWDWADLAEDWKSQGPNLSVEQVLACALPRLRTTTKKTNC